MSNIRETIGAKKKRAMRIISRLHRSYSDADCTLQHRNDWQLLISTILWTRPSIVT